MKTAFSRFASFIVRFRIVVVILLTIITAFLAMKARTLEMIIDPNTLLPQSHPYIATTNLVEKVFGSKYVVVVGLRPKSGDVYQEQVVGKVAQVTQKLYETPGVVHANLLSFSAKRAKDIKGDAEGLKVTPLGPLGTVTSRDVTHIKEALARNPVYQSVLVSPDQRTTAIIVEMKERPGGYRAMMEPIEKIVAETSDQTIDVFVGGNPVFLAASEQFSARMRLLFPLALLVVGLIHFEAFRSLQGLFLPLLTAVGAVIWGLGIMGLFRVPLDIFNAPTPILVLAVAAGHAVQLLKRYYEEFNRLVLQPGLTRVQAKRQAVIDSIGAIGPVMVVAGVVAALGFLSLLVFDIATIRTFGIFTATGILSALVLEMTLIPAVRALLPAPNDKERQLEEKKRIWNTIPGAIANLVLGDKRRMVWIGLAVIAAVSAVGIAQVRVDNANKSYFSSWLPLQKDDVELNSSLAGTNTLYVVVEGKGEDSIKDPAVLRGIDEIQRRLKDQPNVGKTISIADFIKRLNQAMNGDDPNRFTIPDSRELVSQYLFLYSVSGTPTDFNAYVDYQYRRANLTVFLKTGSTAYVNELVPKITAMANEVFGDRVTVSIGGSVAQTAAVTEVMIDGKIKNILQIGGVVFVIASLLFRSVLAGLLVMAPLTLAAIVNFGVMGWAGIPLNIPNSLSTAMAVGIGADYAIYLIYRLREEFQRTGELDAAIRSALASAGKACLFVASAIAGGYGVLLFSFGFKIHNWLGMLIGISMFVSVFAALILIPTVVRVFRPRFIFGTGVGVGVAERATAAALCAVATALFALSGDAEARSASVEQIMEKNLAVTKVKDSLVETTITLINSNGDQRVRKTKGYTKLRPNEYENMRFTRFVEPADVRGTGVLLIEQMKKDDDMWVYLPAFRKTRRLVSSNKRDGFLGTDFSYGDVIGHRVSDWTHQLVREEVIDGAPCYVIESVPKTQKVRSDSGYSKRLSWIRKDNYVIVKGEFWDEAGQPLKTIHTTELKKVDEAANKWQPMFLEAQNVQTGHSTKIRVDVLKVNQDLPDELFAPRQLER